MTTTSRSDTVDVSVKVDAIDTDELLSRCMGRIELMERLLNRFVTASESDFNGICKALQNDDLGELARIAHKLSGTALTVSAKSLASAAKKLEHSAICGDREIGERLVDRVSLEVDAVRTFLNNETRKFSS